MPSILASDGKTQVADLFQVGYTGGAAGTQLTSLTINLNDTTLFDTAAGGAGYGGAFPLTILSHDGFELVDKNGNAVDSVNVADGATTLTLYFKDFNAGEKLVFSVDLDETVGGNATVDGAEIVDQQLTIGGQPYTAKGATLDAAFTAPYMEDAKFRPPSPSSTARQTPPANTSPARFTTCCPTSSTITTPQRPICRLLSTETDMYLFTAGASGKTQVPLRHPVRLRLRRRNNDGIYGSGETPPASR